MLFMDYINLNYVSFYTAKTRRRLRRPTTVASSSRSNLLTSKKATESPVAEKRIDQEPASTTSVSRTRLRSKSKLRGGTAAAAAAAGTTALVASGSSLKGKKTKVDDGTPKIVCYYTNWSQYRVKIGKFVPEDIPADLCTHIIFAFGWLKKGKLSSYESNDETKDNVPGLYERMMNLRKANPKLKVGIYKNFLITLKYLPFDSSKDSARYRRLVVWHTEIQGHVRHTIHSPDLCLLCHSIPAQAWIRWSRHGLGVSQGFG